MCKRKWGQKYYEEHKEEKRIYGQKYYEKNQEEIKTKKRRDNKKNKKQISLKKKAYYQKNKEKLNKKNNKYNIPLAFPLDKNGEVSNELSQEVVDNTFKGIVGHYHLNPEKIDPGSIILKEVREKLK